MDIPEIDDIDSQRPLDPSARGLIIALAMISKKPENDRCKEHGSKPCPMDVTCLPAGVLAEISARLDHKNLEDLSQISPHTHQATEYELALRASTNVYIYPTRDCLQDLLHTLKQRPKIRSIIKRVTVVSDVLVENEWGYGWIWEQVCHNAGLDAQFCDEDQLILYEANLAHAKEAYRNFRFIASGKFRKMLTDVFRLLPNVCEVAIGRLSGGEQIPGWSGPEIIKDLTFYHPDFDTTQIWYGKYSYDMVTREMDVPDPYGVDGPDPLHSHASFFDDFEAACHAAGISNNMIRLHRYEDADLPDNYKLLQSETCTFEHCHFCELDEIHDLESWRAVSPFSHLYPSIFW